MHDHRGDTGTCMGGRRPSPRAGVGAGAGQVVAQPRPWRLSDGERAASATSAGVEEGTVRERGSVYMHVSRSQC